MQTCAIGVYSVMAKNVVPESYFDINVMVKRKEGRDLDKKKKKSSIISENIKGKQNLLEILELYSHLKKELIDLQC